jgi:hypothetical protein
LGSELIKSSSEERSLLKNLGSWLGKLTIGRNQVLRAREIDPKSLIMEVILLDGEVVFFNNNKSHSIFFFIFIFYQLRIIYSLELILLLGRHMRRD